MKNLLKSIVAVMLLTQTVFAADLVNISGASKVAVNGFDTVAFFTQSEAVNGSPFIAAKHQGATYFFSSEKNRALFDANPEKYAPQFGGFCAYGVSINNLFPVDIRTWQVRDGKLYFNLNMDVRKKFDQDAKRNIEKAEANWPGLVKSNTK